MLNHHKKLRETAIIPHTEGRYSCVCDKHVYDNVKNEFVQVNENGYVEIVSDVYPSPILFSFLVAMTYKQAHVPLSLLDKLTILYKDDNPKNYHPSNLLWKFITKLESFNWKGFYYIPGFTRYVVTPNGDVLSLRSGEMLSQHISAVGYPCVRILRDDNKEVIMGVYVLVALAKSDYDNGICDLVIDHIDCDKQNSSEDNVEAVTYGENNRRAVLHGLRNKKFRKVCVKYKNSSAILEFESAASAAKHFNVKNSAIFHHLNKPKSNNAFKDLAFIWYSDLDTPSFDLERPISVKRPVICSNVLTNEVKRFDSFISCYTEMGWTKKTLEYRLKMTDGIIGDWSVNWND